MKLYAVSITNPIGKGKDFWLVHIVMPQISSRCIYFKKCCFWGVCLFVCFLFSHSPWSNGKAAVYRAWILPCGWCLPFYCHLSNSCWAQVHYRWCWGFNLFKWTVVEIFVDSKGWSLDMKRGCCKCTIWVFLKMGYRPVVRHWSFVPPVKRDNL